MAIKTQLTAEEFFDLPFEDEGRCELVFGEIVAMSPPGSPHCLTAAKVAFKLQVHLETAPGGLVFVGAGFVLPLHEDRERVRVPDVAFVAAARVAPLPKYFRGAPELAVEILSPSNEAGDVAQKVREYLDTGARLVWVIAPSARTATVYRADGSARLVRDREFVEGEDVLPGLRVALADLLPDR